MLLPRSGDHPRRNPFRVSDVASSEHFTVAGGDEGSLARPARGQSIRIISPREYSKTSLVTALMEGSTGNTCLSRALSAVHHDYGAPRQPLLYQGELVCGGIIDGGAGATAFPVWSGRPA